MGGHMVSNIPSLETTAYTVSTFYIMHTPLQLKRLQAEEIGEGYAVRPETLVIENRIGSM